MSAFSSVSNGDTGIDDGRCRIRSDVNLCKVFKDGYKCGNTPKNDEWEDESRETISHLPETLELESVSDGVEHPEVDETDESEESELDFYNNCVKAEGDGYDVINARDVINKMHGDSILPSRQWTSGTYQTSGTQRNYVVDYAALRRSGYFLEKQNVNVPKDVPVGLITSNVKMIPPLRDDFPHVIKWINQLPTDAPFLTDSEEDLMGKNEILDVSCHEIWNKYTIDEDHFKDVILNYGDNVKYTSKPVATVNYEKLESILELANQAVDEYLDKMHKDKNHFEYEYVCGKVAPLLCEARKLNDDGVIKSKSTPNNGGISSWLRNRRTHQKSPIQTDEIGSTHKNNIGIKDVDMNHITLEPYHGPISVNGATIDAGSAQHIPNQGKFRNIVEEIKTVLQAIHKALRRNDSLKQLPISQTSSNYQPSKRACDDPEIKKLTKMILDKQQRNNKTTSRTKFILRNLEKSPQYNMRNGPPYIIHHRGNRVFRAINGWIQRDYREVTRRPTCYYRPRYIHLIRDVENNRSQNTENRVNHAQAPNDNNRDQSARDNQAPKNNLISSTFSLIISMMKTIVPFQAPAPSPAIPAYQVEHNQNNQDHALNSRSRSFQGRRNSRESIGNISLSTRYKRMRTQPPQRLRKPR